MENRESEALGCWFTMATEGVVIPVLTGLVAIGGILVYGICLLFRGVAFSAVTVYNWKRSRS